MTAVVNLEQIDADLTEVRRNVEDLDNPWALKALRAAQALRVEVDALNDALGEALIVTDEDEETP